MYLFVFVGLASQLAQRILQMCNRLVLVLYAVYGALDLVQVRVDLLELLHARAHTNEVRLYGRLELSLNHILSHLFIYILNELNQRSSCFITKTEMRLPFSSR